MLEILLSLLGFVLFLHYYLLWDLYKAWWKLPKTFTLPFLGSIWYTRRMAKDILSTLRSSLEENDSRIAFWLGQNLLMVTSKVKDCEVLMSSGEAIEKLPALYDKMRDVIGQGLIISKAERWRRNRKLLNRGFKKTDLESFVSDMYEKSEIFVENLRKDFKPNEDILMHMYDYTLNAFCANFLGVNGEIANKKYRWGKLMTHINFQTVERMANPKYFFDFVYFRTVLGKRYLESTRKLAEFRQILVDQSNENLAYDSPESGKNQDHLFNKVKDPNLLPNEEYMDEFSTFLIASTDTTSLTLGYATVLLGVYPDIQEEIYDEIVSVLDGRKEITFCDLRELKYVERFINESLRLFPVAPILGRVLGAKMDFGDITLPAGTGVALNVNQIHRDPANFPEPLRFDPNRFLPEECAKRNPYTYLPFSVGNRNCIGGKYAMMEMKVGLTNLIRNFRISTEYKSVEEMESVCIVFSKLKNGFTCTLQPR